MKTKLFPYLYLIVLLFFCSCKTYTKFYSKTYNTTELSKVSEVYRLNLSHQNLSTVPENTFNLPKLKMLSLSGNQLLNLDNTFKNIRYPEQLEILILDSLSISTLPKSILRFKNLKQLSLAYNADLNLDHTFNLIDNLPLKFLNLKGNAIEALPESIVQLVTLKDINLSYNHLTDSKSYNYLGQLPKLYSVWIDHNNLDALPHTIKALHQIRYFYIDNNNLSKLPKEISGMKSLWVIHAGYNKFTELPKEFIAMKSLLMIHINNNNISTIPQAYETKKFAFKGLLLDNNPISMDEKAIKKAKKICKGFFLLSFQQKVYKY